MVQTLKRCSESSAFDKTIGKCWISFFVGDIISRIGLGLFGQGHRAPTAKGNFLTQVFSGN